MADSLGAILSGARNRLGWSLRDAERASGVPSAYISQVETGLIREPGLVPLAKLATAYGITMSQLVQLDSPHAGRGIRLAGHALQHEGKPFECAFPPKSPDDPDWVRLRGWLGHGVCECGAASPDLSSDADRKRWHRAHKDEERREVVPVEGSEDA